jgi:ParB/RepB/Spo0J family partition protein
MTTTKKLEKLKITADEIQQIEINRLIVAVDEPRKTLDQAALRELAASIAQAGIQEPLLVRAVGGAAGPFEIVAGQRRWQAAKLAGKTSVPCIVREMSDAAAREARIISNLQREDLAPLDEAEAYAKLLAAPGATIESIAATLGKAASYVGRRCKLLDAIEPVHEALAAGAIEVGHALELARLDQDHQRRLLFAMRTGYNCASSSEDDEVEEPEPDTCIYCGCSENDACRLEDGTNCSWLNAERTICSNPECVAQARAPKWTPTPWSVAQLRSEIKRTTLRLLADAPFPLDAEIPPQACAGCPKRSDNAVLLFEDCAQDTCTDAECFEAKVKIWVKSELQRADDEKRKLVMLADGYTSDRAAVSRYNVEILQPGSECPSVEEAIWINGNHAGHLTKICRDPKCKTHKNSLAIEREDPAKAKANRKKLLEKINAEKKYRVALLTAVARASVPAQAADALNAEVCLFAIRRSNSQYGAKLGEALGWPPQFFGWQGKAALEKQMKGLAPVERARVALLAAHSGELCVNEYSLKSKPENLETLAKLLNVNLKAVRTSVEPKAKEAPAKKAIAKKAEKKPVPTLKPEDRKRIAAAVKKRWAKAKKGGGA